MISPRPWVLSAAMIAALAGAANAEMTVSQSNDPSARVHESLASLLDTEHTSLGALDNLSLTAPAKKSAGKGVGTAAAAGIGYDEVWLAQQPKATGDAEFTCLATALYFEARGESIRGQAAVAEVILNRAETPDFPRTICGVVNQGNSRGCQFSYTCDGVRDAVREKAAWERSAKIARAMLDGAPRELTDGATYFQAPAVRPGWSRRFERTARIGAHIFYRAPIRTAMN